MYMYRCNYVSLNLSGVRRDTVTQCPQYVSCNMACVAAVWSAVGHVSFDRVGRGFFSFLFFV